MRYTELLTARVRRHTLNEDFSSTSGIADQNIIDYLNDGVRMLQALLYPEIEDFLLRLKRLV